MQLRWRPLRVRFPCHRGSRDGHAARGPISSEAANSSLGGEGGERNAAQGQARQTQASALWTVLSLPSAGWAAPSHLACPLWAADLGFQPLSTGPTKAHIGPTVTSEDSTQKKGLLGVGQGHGPLLAYHKMNFLFSIKGSGHGAPSLRGGGVGRGTAGSGGNPSSPAAAARP